MSTKAANSDRLESVVVGVNDPLSGALLPHDSPPSDVAEGCVVVHIVKLVLTSNTVTYCLMGKLPGFATFDHFPIADAEQADRYARNPCWGTGVVTVSRCANVSVGTRIHGYFPLAPWCVLQPGDVGKVAKGQFMDLAAHRLPLLAPYRTYTTATRPDNDDEEDLRTADGLLFSTGWGMAQQLALSGTGAEAMILTSASSRTAPSYSAPACTTRCLVTTTPPTENSRCSGMASGCSTWPAPSRWRCPSVHTTARGSRRGAVWARRTRPTAGPPSSAAAAVW